jgi:hypothetical protein
LKIASNVLSLEGTWQLMNTCFQPWQGVAFFSNVNKHDKFGIKFLLASGVMSSYLLNGFPYLGTEEYQLSDRLQVCYAVLHLKEPYVNKG